jgi:DNA polymerase III delta subunit
MLKPVYALVGPDSFLQLQALSSLLAQSPGSAQRLDIDGERAELADVLDELRSFSMFGDGKIVVVANADAFVTNYREPLEQYVAAPSSSATLVLRLSSLPANQRIHKAINKIGAIVKCDSPKDLSGWIVQHAKQAHQLLIKPDAARLLADLIGSDLGRIDSELAKLALQSEGKPVTPELISGTVAFQREQEMWNMTNELASGRPAEALRRWRQLVQLDPSTEFRAVTWLTMWLEKVNQALRMKRSGMNPFTIAQQLKIWPREMQQPFLRTADTLGEPGVAEALDLLAEIDRQSKTGVGDAASNVERFMLSLPLGSR